MRISDWRSDVCSSDRGARHTGSVVHPGPAVRGAHARGRRDRPADHPRASRQARAARCCPTRSCGSSARRRMRHRDLRHLGEAAPRSEEHTSELQSLMRISYAVFCLKKKTNINISYKSNLNISTSYSHLYNSSFVTTCVTFT